MKSRIHANRCIVQTKLEEGRKAVLTPRDETQRIRHRAKRRSEVKACLHALPGNPVHDVGLTGLATLAFLGDGSTMRSGPYKEVVKSAVKMSAHADRALEILRER